MKVIYCYAIEAQCYALERERPTEVYSEQLMKGTVAEHALLLSKPRLHVLLTMLVFESTVVVLHCLCTITLLMW